jgi:hypothetical protein
MVINPQQASEKYLAKNANLLKKLEEKIDTALVDRFNLGHNKQVLIDLRELSPESPLLEKIKEMYEAAGWNVSYQFDRRNGDYLRFLPGGGRI